jgi:hypothetical protein
MLNAECGLADEKNSNAEAFGNSALSNQQSEFSANRL